MHDARLKLPANRWVLRAVASACFLIFLATGFREGFLRDETDFPNYYTAAVLVRKSAPLRNFYDWTWIAREMDKAGAGPRIGNYTPQTPLTMLPLVGLAGLPMQRAKQVWLVFNLFFLMGTLLMLSRITGRSVEQLWLFTFFGYYSLNENFALGQYYVFLLFLLSLTVYLLHKQRPWAAGAMAGLTFALRLYGGPYLLYFVAARKWRSVAGMIAGMAGAAAAAIAIFGWSDVRYFVQLMPRFLEGGAIDPYNAGNQTLSTLLRICFFRDPQLNPHPLWDAPSLLFFGRAFFSLIISVLLYLGIRKSEGTERDFGWSLFAILLISSNVSQYTLILMLLPVVFLLEEKRPVRNIYLALSCLLLTLPLHLPRFFPRLWLMAGLFLVFGWERWKQVSIRSLAWSAAFVAVCSALISSYQMRSYRVEPGRRAEQLVFRDASLFASFPVITSAGLYFQSMGPNRYVVRWFHDATLEEVNLGGNAFRPIPVNDGSSIAFEESMGGRSTMTLFDPTNRRLTPIPLPVAPTDEVTSATSPDGKWIAYTSGQPGFRNLWVRNVERGDRVLLGGGQCDSFWPAWDLDSRSVVFASDCGRAVGLPALYRAAVPTL